MKDDHGEILINEGNPIGVLRILGCSIGGLVDVGAQGVIIRRNFCPLSIFFILLVSDKLFDVFIKSVVSGFNIYSFRDKNKENYEV